ncbi:MAG: hypothetical protein GQ474_00070 [Sulfurimonas sp.]|nr:hypothetical protein [Sulfurimonas sp.]
MKFAIKFILTLLLFASFSSSLLADKDWGCDGKRVGVPTSEMSVTVAIKE